MICNMMLRPSGLMLQQACMIWHACVMGTQHLLLQMNLLQPAKEQQRLA
jgi:hypothetical protein